MSHGQCRYDREAPAATKLPSMIVSAADFRIAPWRCDHGVRKRERLQPGELQETPGIRSEACPIPARRWSRRRSAPAARAGSGRYTYARFRKPARARNPAPTRPRRGWCKVHRERPRRRQRQPATPAEFGDATVVRHQRTDLVPVPAWTDRAPAEKLAITHEGTTDMPRRADPAPQEGGARSRKHRRIVRLYSRQRDVAQRDDPTLRHRRHRDDAAVTDVGLGEPKS